MHMTITIHPRIVLDKMMPGIYAAKALEQHLCERFNDAVNVRIFIPSV
jgi:hypothetical protein